MRELNLNEVGCVGGGETLSFTQGGVLIIGLALSTPVTAPLALIGLAVLYVGQYQDK